jgi:hypothetical protein
VPSTHPFSGYAFGDLPYETMFLISGKVGKTICHLQNLFTSFIFFF